MPSWSPLFRLAAWARNKNNGGKVVAHTPALRVIAARHPQHSQLVFAGWLLQVNEELYIFISGQGEMSIDDEIIPVQEGSVVSVQPDARRAWWNTGDSEFTYIVIQAPVGRLKAATLEDGEILEGAVPWS